MLTAIMQFTNFTGHCLSIASHVISMLSWLNWLWSLFIEIWLPAHKFCH